jgi:hypothetical protein
VDRKLLDADGAGEAGRRRPDGALHRERSGPDREGHADPTGVALVGERAARERDPDVERLAFLEEAHLRVGDVDHVHRPVPGRRRRARTVRGWRFLRR